MGQSPLQVRPAGNEVPLPPLQASRFIRADYDPITEYETRRLLDEIYARDAPERRRRTVFRVPEVSTPYNTIIGGDRLTPAERIDIQDAISSLQARLSRDHSASQPEEDEYSRETKEMIARIDTLQAQIAVIRAEAERSAALARAEAEIYRPGLEPYPPVPTFTKKQRGKLFETPLPPQLVQPYEDIPHDLGPESPFRGPTPPRLSQEPPTIPTQLASLPSPPPNRGPKRRRVTEEVYVPETPPEVLMAQAMGGPLAGMAVQERLMENVTIPATQMAFDAATNTTGPMEEHLDYLALDEAMTLCCEVFIQPRRLILPPNWFFNQEIVLTEYGLPDGYGNAWLNIVCQVLRPEPALLQPIRGAQDLGCFQLARWNFCKYRLPLPNPNETPSFKAIEAAQADVTKQSDLDPKYGDLNRWSKGRAVFITQAIIGWINCFPYITVEQEGERQAARIHFINEQPFDFEFKRIGKMLAESWARDGEHSPFRQSTPCLMAAIGVGLIMSSYYPMTYDICFGQGHCTMRSIAVATFGAKYGGPEFLSDRFLRFVQPLLPTFDVVQPYYDKPGHQFNAMVPTIHNYMKAMFGMADARTNPWVQAFLAVVMSMDDDWFNPRASSSTANMTPDVPE